MFSLKHCLFLSFLWLLQLQISQQSVLINRDRNLIDGDLWKDLNHVRNQRDLVKMSIDIEPVVKVIVDGFRGNSDTATTSKPVERKRRGLLDVNSNRQHLIDGDLSRDFNHVRNQGDLVKMSIDIEPVVKVIVDGLRGNSDTATTSKPVERKRRGLLDVNLDVEPVLSLLTGKTKETTTEAATSTRKPSIANRYKVTNKNQDLEIPKCGRKLVQHTELITNGLATKPGDWPWHAAIYRLKDTRSQQQYICGGTLLSHTRVLTAAHCVVENNAVILPERLFVVLGKYNLAGGDMDSQEKSVFDIIVHPEFSRTSLTHDIAVIKLSSRVTYSHYILPICLWSTSKSDKSHIVNKHGTVVGWGFNENDALSTQLTMAKMPVATDMQCIKSNPTFYSQFVSDETFCAGFRNGTSVCNGDSGGGMYFPLRDEDDEEIWSLRGIVSLSVSRKDRNLCNPNEYTIFTDAAQYLDFINNHI